MVGKFFLMALRLPDGEATIQQLSLQRDGILKMAHSIVLARAPVKLAEQVAAISYMIKSSATLNYLLSGRYLKEATAVYFFLHRRYRILRSINQHLKCRFWITKYTPMHNWV
jgi:hypothetical protein